MAGFSPSFLLNSSKEHLSKDKAMNSLLTTGRPSARHVRTVLLWVGAIALFLLGLRFLTTAVRESDYSLNDANSVNGVNDASGFSEEKDDRGASAFSPREKLSVRVRNRAAARARKAEGLNDTVAMEAPEHNNATTLKEILSNLPGNTLAGLRLQGVTSKKPSKSEVQAYLVSVGQNYEPGGGATPDDVARAMAELVAKPEEQIPVKDMISKWNAEVGCNKFRHMHRDLIESFKGPSSSWRNNPSIQSTGEPACSRMKKSHVTILLEGDGAWFLPDTKEAFHVCERCGVTCRFTWHPHLAPFPDARMYVDHNKPSDKSTLNIFMNLEAHMRWGENVDLVDITVGYHKDRDVQVTYADIINERQRRLSAYKLKNVLLYRAGSNCKVPWRNALLEGLYRQVPHHSYGACNNNVGGLDKETVVLPQCSRQLNDQPKQGLAHCLMSHYMFHLAFENTKTESYVTEKLFESLESGTVPIYMGAPDIANFAPPGSYIDASQFSTPEELAQFVKDVSLDPVRYMNYSAWSMCGVLGNFAQAQAISFNNLPCRLCEKVSSMYSKDR